MITTKEQQEKFLTLYKPIHDRFERFCRARVFGNMEYQDLMNETLLVAFKKFNTLKKRIRLTESFIQHYIKIQR